MNRSNTPLRDASNTSELERRVSARLTRYAESMPPAASVEARVRERLATEPAPDARPARGHWLPAPRPGASRGAGGWARGAVSLGLVAALIAGFVGVVWLRNGARGSGATTGQCTEITKNGTLPYLCPPPTPVKATVEVTQSYADSIRTAVQLRIATPGALIPHDRPIIYSRPNQLMIEGAALRDAQGHSYATSGLATGAFGYLDGQDVATDFYEFDPLPQSALSSPQTLTLRIDKLYLLYDQMYEIVVNGPWTLTFQVTRQPGRSINFHVAPQTHNGITIQPLRLDVAPRGGAFDPYGDGGARLILRISGLDPQASLLGLRSFETEAHFPGGSGWSGSGGPKLLFEGRRPASIVGAGVVGPSAVVGPTRTIDMEIIFLGPPLARLTGTQTLSIDQLVVSVDPKTALPTKTVKGPWVVQIPLG